MEELTQRLREKAGLSQEQAAQVIEEIKNFVKEKFPMLAGAVDNVFPSAGQVAKGASTDSSAEFPGL